jgi:hypothetical protein
MLTRLVTRANRDPRVNISFFSTSLMFPRPAFSIARNALSFANKRSFHPLAGSLREIQDKWHSPPSTSLVPIVIEQTV